MIAANPLAETFSRDQRDSAILIVDGYGISLSVIRGHLLIRDGLGQHRRERRLPRAQRTVSRIVIIGHTGHLTLEAIRWCHDTGIAVVNLDSDGTTLLTAGRAGVNDARLRRAQAAAPAGPVGLEIAHELLGAKVDGQAAVAGSVLQAPSVVDRLEKLAGQLRVGEDLVQCRELEAQASSVYFGAWTRTVACRFAERDAGKVPSHWSFFGRRSSLLRTGGKSPRLAADPINALLNYGYALAEAEARLAALAMGLDPGLGIIHTDIRNRDSLALDLLEPLRPPVEQHVLELLAVRHFTTADFHETRQGACRLLPPLTHDLAARMSGYAQAVAPIAERVAHALASSSPGAVSLTTPLSRSNNVAAQTRRRPPAPHRGGDAMPTCRSCGTQLYNKTRTFCSACWPVHRNAFAQLRNQASQANRAVAQAAGKDPSQTAQARAKRHDSLVAAKADEKAWADTGGVPSITEQQLYEEVLPQLKLLPLSHMERATGLSNSSCSRIRSGQMTPHPRHWEALALLAGDL